MGAQKNWTGHFVEKWALFEQGVSMSEGITNERITTEKLGSHTHSVRAQRMGQKWALEKGTLKKNFASEM